MNCWTFAIFLRLILDESKLVVIDWPHTGVRLGNIVIHYRTDTPKRWYNTLSYVGYIDIERANKYGI